MTESAGLRPARSDLLGKLAQSASAYPFVERSSSAHFSLNVRRLSSMSLSVLVSSLIVILAKPAMHILQAHARLPAATVCSPPRVTSTHALVVYFWVSFWSHSVEDETSRIISRNTKCMCEGRSLNRHSLVQN
ncbi:hypothetical protein BaRGS_00015644 [Batillaria attramentaria]|uniref:Uncharacterized protein n=1 Tax=Batillaria attramentaria TaxID=370345 RepID=A0ABD0L1D4_9CAEN